MNAYFAHVRQSAQKIFLHVAGVAMLVFGLLALKSIVLYSPFDTSFNTAGIISQSIIDRIGAYYADLVLQTFGVGSFFLTATVLVWGYRLARHARMRTWYLRVILFFVSLSFITTGSIVLKAVLPYSQIDVPVQGIFGLLLWQGLNAVLSSYTNFFLAIMLILGLGVYFYETKEVLFLGYRIFLIIRGVFAFFRHAIQYILRKMRTKTTIALEKKTTDRHRRKDTVSMKDKKSTENQKKIATGDTFILPHKGLLRAAPKDQKSLLDKEEQRKNAESLERVLAEFGVQGRIIRIRSGPVVTTYELDPAPGVRIARIINLTEDIARTMGAQSVRISKIPGKTVIGVEIPNIKPETVTYRNLIASKAFEDNALRLPLVLGENIEGEERVADLSTMPHLLIGGTTGSGKSVGLNAMILSLLFKYSPEDLRLIMIDPKMLEFSIYRDIPHLLCPVVTDSRKAIFALKWAVREMENRYQAISKIGVRGIEGYNQKIQVARRSGQIITDTIQVGFNEDGSPIFEEQIFKLKTLPYIVVIVDEMADLMLVAGKEIEASIQRLAQMARAAGIHLIMATQRPSVDVITGTIKANFPTRIAYRVTSKIDSRTILGEQGAEQLLGCGDFLIMESGGRITRHHAPFVQDSEVQAVCHWLRKQKKPQYVNSVTDDKNFDEVHQKDISYPGVTEEKSEKKRKMYRDAVALVTRTGRASTSFVQRSLNIGYNHAADIMDKMEQESIVSKPNNKGRRELLVPRKQQ